jgi:RNA polymerase sigma factor (sigma-70 family)
VNRSGRAAAARLADAARASAQQAGRASGMDEAAAGESRSDPAQVQEAALLGRISMGDRAAFETLYRHYFPRLSRFLQRLLRRADTVEEALNDTMLVVWRKAGTFNGQSKVSTWIFSIAYRKALKARGRFDEPMASDDSLYEATQPGPEEQMIRRQLCERVSECIDAMSVEQRTVIELTIFHGCAYREIAQIMECPIDTVKTRMFHARRRLRTLLPEGGEAGL